MTTARLNKILWAAMNLVLQKGVNALTIEAVAREAKFSKGGVLYHFPSKESLVQGMVASLVAAFEIDVARCLSEDTETVGAFTRAYLTASLLPSDTASDDVPSKMGLFAALSAATAMNPKLLDPLRDGYRQFQEQLQHDGIDPVVASIIRMAVDGIWFAEVLDFAPPAAKLRGQIVTHLIEMTRPAAPALKQTSKRK